MHYHAEVYLPQKPKNIEAAFVAVSKILSPFREERRDGFFDWFQIGGRWKGAHNPGYDPNEDPTHQQVCRWCNGTGARPEMATIVNGEKKFKDPWAEQCNGCNSCKGTGIEVIWPTQWPPTWDTCICELNELPDNFSCYTLIIGSPSGRYSARMTKVYHKEEWTGSKFVEGPLANVENLKKFLTEDLGLSSGYLVTVDYHS